MKVFRLSKSALTFSTWFGRFWSSLISLYHHRWLIHPITFVWVRLLSLLTSDFLRIAFSPVEVSHPRVRFGMTTWLPVFRSPKMLLFSVILSCPKTFILVGYLQPYSVILIVQIWVNLPRRFFRGVRIRAIPTVFATGKLER